MKQNLFNKFVLLKMLEILTAASLLLISIYFSGSLYRIIANDSRVPHIREIMVILFLISASLSILSLVLNVIFNKDKQVKIIKIVGFCGVFALITVFFVLVMTL